MDLSSWIDSNSTCKRVHTRKKYFGQYLYRVKIYVPFGILLRHRFVDDSIEPIWNQISYEVTHRKERQRKQIAMYISSYWTDRLIRDSDNCDIDQLEYLYHKRKKLGKNIKLRVESPYIEIYAASEQIILDIVQKMPKRQDRVIEIHHPESEKVAEVLDRGEIIKPKITNYSHQVNLRTLRLSDEKRQQIYEYLESLGSVVQLTPGLKDCLTRASWGTQNSMWVYQTYFYTNDTSVCTFLNLIEPQLINKILKIANVGH